LADIGNNEDLPATGARLWAVQRTTQARPVFDAVSPDGSQVFVTGLGTPAVGNWNFVTYRA
jgi:hypothetical protein